MMIEQSLIEQFKNRTNYISLYLISIPNLHSTSFPKIIAPRPLYHIYILLSNHLKQHHGTMVLLHVGPGENTDTYTFIWRKFFSERSYWISWIQTQRNQEIRYTRRIYFASLYKETSYGPGLEQFSEQTTWKITK